MRIENATQAFNRLKNRKDYFLVKINDNLYHDHYLDGEPIEYTARELIKLARAYSSDNNQETTIKKNLKKFTNDMNRSATRDKIKTEEFDDIPQSGVMKKDDRWNWT